jgi:hypothetical protein
MPRLDVCRHRTRPSNEIANAITVWRGVYIRLVVCKYNERRECMPCVTNVMRIIQSVVGKSTVLLPNCSAAQTVASKSLYSDWVVSMVSSQCRWCGPLRRQCTIAQSIRRGRARPGPGCTDTQGRGERMHGTSHQCLLGTSPVGRSVACCQVLSWKTYRATCGKLELSCGSC